MKICSKCKQEKQVEEFSGKNSQCKKCRNEAIREHQRLPEVKAQRAKYELKNRDRIRRKARERYQINKEREKNE